VDHSPVAPGGPAPYLVGEHTHQVLAGLGYSAERIQALQAQQVIEVPDSN
jgi:crotonobetainyl-CoA:carnitine CoA-transferase CaiB-like acyl-CoA transferase